MSVACTVTTASDPASYSGSGSVPGGTTVSCTGIDPGTFWVSWTVQSGGNSWHFRIEDQSDSHYLGDTVTIPNVVSGTLYATPAGHAYVQAFVSVGDSTPSSGITEVILSPRGNDPCSPSCGAYSLGLPAPVTYNPLADGSSAAGSAGSLAGAVISLVFAGVVGLVVLRWGLRYIRRRALSA